MNYNIKSMQHQIENIRANIRYFQNYCKSEDLTRKDLKHFLQNLLLRKPCEPDTMEEIIIPTTAPYTLYLWDADGREQNKPYYDLEDINTYYERQKRKYRCAIVYKLKPKYNWQRPNIRLHTYRYHYKPATLIKHLEYILREYDYDIKQYHQWVKGKIHDLESIIREYKEKAEFCETCGA